MRGTWRKGSSTGNPKYMLTKALEMGVSIGPRFWGTLRDAPFLYIKYTQNLQFTSQCFM
jgi:hypothetical protein